MNNSTGSNWLKAENHLSRVDKQLKELIAKYGPCQLLPRPESEYFIALCDSIVGQQLSTKVARVIRERFCSYFDGQPTPRSVSECPVDTLRSLGLSGQKTSYMLDLAQKFLDGHITPNCFAAMSDEEIIKQLVSVKGIGVWTVQMFLIFALNRPDVFPSDDLGIKKAIQNLKYLPELPSKTFMLDCSEPWRPYTTVASWYLWRSLDNMTL